MKKWRKVSEVNMERRFKGFNTWVEWATKYTNATKLLNKLENVFKQPLVIKQWFQEIQDCYFGEIEVEKKRKVYEAHIYFNLKRTYLKNLVLGTKVQKYQREWIGRPTFVAWKRYVENVKQTRKVEIYQVSIFYIWNYLF